MNRKIIPALLASAVTASACTIPTDPLDNNIAYPFRAQVQNATRPEVHNKYMNLFEAGGGDRHLFIGPVGVPTYDLTLVDGVINHVPDGVRAVIGGEIDHTTKMFMTGRGDPRAIFKPTYACNPDTDALQIELRFVTWQDQPTGGHICVRSSFEESHEFRYYPPGNTLVDPNRECIKVTLVVIPTTDLPPQTSTTLSTSTIPATSTTTTSTRTSTATSTPSSAPFVDLTSSGFRFVGCAPEERWTTDGAFRTLPDASTSTDTNTNAACAAFCTAGGFKYAGTEWSRECWCGKAVVATRWPATTLASLEGCNFRCTGDEGEICGGDARLSLYEKCDSGEACENVVFT
ncbi:WSC domain-containing protein [Dichotomopilus funicola]|uniref:WSC domain-containing protein n=1 Tax=Dichotomopilus funicola TaxID=1934379 RepID=A0AAN6ZPG8_9PEZI|nr:WSC domain-containing protein [Dichotomopilus funicola]